MGRDIAKQRVAQRKWAAKRAAALKAAEPPFDVHIGRARRGWEVMPTTEQLKAITSFGQCVSTAQELKVNTTTSRMPIAALAVRSCEIEHGGKRVKGQKLHGTIGEFAAGVGVSPKTLWSWIDAYKFARDNLPESTERVKLTAVQDAMYWSARTGEDAVALYRAFASDTDPRGKALTAIERFRSALHFIKKYGLKYFREHELKLIAEWHGVVQSLLENNKGEKACRKKLSTNTKGHLKPVTNLDGATEKNAPLPRTLPGAGNTLPAPNVSEQNKV